MLIVCTTCRRHIRSAADCPFCARRARRRNAGLALVAAATMAACQSSPTPPTAEQPATVTPDQATAPAEPKPEEKPQVIAEKPAEEEAKPEATDKPAEDAKPEATNKPSGITASNPTANSPVAAPSYKRPIAMRYGIAPRPRPKPKQPQKK